MFASVLMLWIALGMSSCVDSGDLTDLLESVLDRTPGSSEKPENAPEQTGTSAEPPHPDASPETQKDKTKPDRKYIYQWTDHDGNVHFTTELSRVPAAYRQDMRRIPKSPSSEPPTVVPPVFPDPSYESPPDIPSNRELERIRRARNADEVRRARQRNRENMNRASEKARMDERREREERKREEKERERWERNHYQYQYHSLPCWRSTMKKAMKAYGKKKKK